ncbi:MAG TPA: hypothetical protein VNX22_10000 [Acidobacteriaceae bacterium]|nr:hypothetical protein [Acidobacteriaceae bacterium]
MPSTGLAQGSGSYVYSALDKFDPNGLRDWTSISSFGSGPAPDIKALVKQVTIAPEFLEHLRTAVSPGTTLIITDVHVSAQTRSEPGFNILTTD